MTEICTASEAAPPVPRRDPETGALRTRSAVSNGKRTHVRPIGDSAWSRRHRDLLDGFICQFDATAEADLALCRRSAGLAAWLEQREAEIAQGEPVDIGTTTTAANTLRRLLSDLRASAGRRKRGGAS
jgi:hypothetical protein